VDEQPWGGRSGERNCSRRGGRAREPTGDSDERLGWPTPGVYSAGGETDQDGGGFGVEGIVGKESIAKGIKKPVGDFLEAPEVLQRPFPRPRRHVLEQAPLLQ
jgi:hypothetical protein